MNVLFVYPEFPVTHWNFKHILKLISKKATEPPLGLLTVSSLLPEDWNKKLIDMNVSKLKEKDLKQADIVFISGMIIQKASFTETAERCLKLGVKTVAGGPMVTENHADFPFIDHFILGEAENVINFFLRDLKSGNLKKIYKSPDFPDIKTTPVPDWDLINMNSYTTMDIQYSRGCPFDCEFCSITSLFGHKSRIKSSNQFIAELDSLYTAGWRGNVFIVDDNFIGNKNILKTDLLPALIKWQQKKYYPFTFNTEVSVNLADDEKLMDMMVESGFTACFTGIETPSEEGLKECGKNQNRSRNLVEAVKIMQRKGFNVSGGFIIGFDSDEDNIFSRQFDFIQKSGIVNAMVGLLNAPYGTRLYKRLKAENRILKGSTGNNTDGSLNFITKMNPIKLIKNYENLVKKIYSPRHYLERVMTFLSEYKLPEINFNLQRKRKLLTAFKAVIMLGLFQNRGKLQFWKLIRSTLKNYPAKISTAITLAVYGLHFRKVSEHIK